MRVFPAATIAALSLVMSGCVASKIITAPIRAAGTVVETAVDATTQSRSEKEEDVGRRVLAERKQQREECLDDAENRRERKQCKERFSDDY